jgi:hypothetical protein
VVSCGEPAGVAGLGQDRRGPDCGQPGDRGDQLGQLKLVEHPGHRLLGVGELALGVPPVLKQ